MKVLFQHLTPFAWAHGGFQIQIEETKAALERRGIEVEPIRWWDEKQRGDLIHHFGIPPLWHLEMTRTQAIPSVVTHLFSAACNRPPSRLALQGLLTKMLLRLPTPMKNQVNWKSFSLADRMIVGIEAERRVLETVYGLHSNAIVRVPLGLPSEYLQAKPGLRDRPYLITTGTITAAKRSIELAEMARAAEVPVLFVGKPYSPTDPYGKAFAKLVDGRFVLYHSHVADRSQMVDLLRASRGFVIFSRFENWCLSAHEAAACGLPVLLPDQPWAHECFNGQASYLSSRSRRDRASQLRAFYEACPRLPSPEIKLYSWDEVAAQLEICYRSLLNGPGK